MDRHDVENLRRSVVMLPAGSAQGLDREQAAQLLERLFELERLVEKLRCMLTDLEDGV